MGGEENCRELPLDRVPFDRLFRELGHGGSLTAWNKEFDEIVRAVANEVKRLTPEDQFTDDVAGSWIRTFLRRVKDGDDPKLNAVEGPEALFGYLVALAIDKIWKQRNQARDRREVNVSRLTPKGFDFVDKSSKEGGGTENTERDDRGVIRAAIADQLRTLFEKVNLLNTNRNRREASYLLLLKEFRPHLRSEDIHALSGGRIGRLTLGEIAKVTGVSERTLRRQNEQEEPIRKRLVEESVRAVRSLQAVLRQDANS